MPRHGYARLKTSRTRATSSAATIPRSGFVLGSKTAIERNLRIGAARVAPERPTIRAGLLSSCVSRFPNSTLADCYTFEAAG